MTVELKGKPAIGETPPRPDINGVDKVLIGTRKEDNTNIYMTKPSWDCGWYWSFGYLGNRHEHYHLDSYQSKDHMFKLEDGGYKHITEQRNIDMHEALITDYHLVKHIEENLWVLTELALTIYQLKETAEVLGRGGSHMTTNPCAQFIKDTEYMHHINRDVLPEVMQKFWNIMTKAA